MQRQADALLKARTDDPAGYAMRDPAVAAAAHAAQQDPGQGPVYIDKSLAAQAALGIPESDRRSLPKETARRMVGAIAGAADPQQAADLIEHTAKQYGPRWAGVYADLVREKLPDEYATLAMLDGPQDGPVRNDLVQAMKSKKGFEDTLPAATRTEIDKAVQGELDDWARAETARGGTNRNVAAVTRSAQYLAYRYAEGGASSSSAARQAAGGMVLDRYDVIATDRVRLYAPKGMGDQVELNAGKMLGSITADMLPVPAARPGETLTEAQRQAAYLKAVQQGHWVLNAGGDGALLLDKIGQPVFTSGNRVGFKFADMAKLEKNFTIGDPMGLAP